MKHEVINMYCVKTTPSDGDSGIFPRLRLARLLLERLGKNKLSAAIEIAAGLIAQSEIDLKDSAAALERKDIEIKRLKDLIEIERMDWNEIYDGASI